MSISIQLSGVSPSSNFFADRRFIRLSAHLAWLILATGLTSLSGCDARREPAPATETPVSAPQATATPPFWQQGSDCLRAAATQAQRLQRRVAALLQTPSEESLQSAREQWQITHGAINTCRPYTIVGQFHDELFHGLETLWQNLDAWPIEPGYLDSYGPYTHSGLVHDVTLPINAEQLRHQHQFSDIAEVSLGLHPMAYLLWGESGNREPDVFFPATGATDQDSASEDKISIVDKPANRRRTMLQIQAQLLVDDANKLRSRWDRLHDTYQALGEAAKTELWQSCWQRWERQQTDRAAAKPAAGENTAGALIPWQETIHFKPNDLSGLRSQLEASGPTRMSRLGGRN